MVMPTDDKSGSQESGHGGAREGAGRPLARNKTDSTVSFRLTAAEFLERSKAAEKAGYSSIHAWAKALLLDA